MHHFNAWKFNALAVSTHRHTESVIAVGVEIVGFALVKFLRRRFHIVNSVHKIYAECEVDFFTVNVRYHIVFLKDTFARFVDVHGGAVINDLWHVIPHRAKQYPRKKNGGQKIHSHAREKNDNALPRFLLIKRLILNLNNVRTNRLAVILLAIERAVSAQRKNAQRKFFARLFGGARKYSLSKANRKLVNFKF